MRDLLSVELIKVRASRAGMALANVRAGVAGHRSACNVITLQLASWLAWPVAAFVQMVRYLLAMCKFP